MKIIESYKTLQGEGRYLGVPSYFIRTSGCNLRCSWKDKDGTQFCDTPYSSFFPEIGKELDIESLKTNLKHIVITGGEPLIHADIVEVCNKLSDEGFKVTVETNGTIYREMNAFMSISPKLSNSDYQPSERLKQFHRKNREFLESTKRWTMSNDYQLKFVVNEQKDMAEINQAIKDLGVPHNKVYLMPQGVKLEDLIEKGKWIFRECLKYGYNFTPRLQIELFGHKRGI